jgi:hypothetical protein
MNWASILAYVTGTVDQELLLRSQYLAAENRILKAKLKGRVRISDDERARLGEIGHRLGRRVLGELIANTPAEEEINEADSSLLGPRGADVTTNARKFLAQFHHRSAPVPAPFCNFYRTINCHRSELGEPCVSRFGTRGNRSHDDNVPFHTDCGAGDEAYINQRRITAVCRPS